MTESRNDRYLRNNAYRRLKQPQLSAAIKWTYVKTLGGTLECLEYDLGQAYKMVVVVALLVGKAIRRQGCAVQATFFWELQSFSPSSP